MLVSGTGAGVAQLWDFADAGPDALVPLPGHGAVLALGFDPSGRHYAFGLEAEAVEVPDLDRLGAGLDRLDPGW